MSKQKHKNEYALPKTFWIIFIIIVVVVIGFLLVAVLADWVAGIPSGSR